MDKDLVIEDKDKDFFEDKDFPRGQLHCLEIGYGMHAL